ncbi:MAG: hypothetical protein JNM84_06690 [Planctomycetes bacterium]|nr:hypothetical protein [Planctomycetota bacterium]
MQRFSQGLDLVQRHTEGRRSPSFRQHGIIEKVEVARRERLEHPLLRGTELEWFHRPHFKKDRRPLRDARGGP